jgi:hypothetical protein
MNHSVNEYLIQLHELHGTLTPDLVVEDAKRPDSPLHELFDWDVQRAAEAHWREVARQLIRNVRVVITNESRTIKAPYFMRNPECGAREQGYTSVVRVRNDAEIAREVVLEECGRVYASLTRAQAVAAAVGVEHDILQLLQMTLNVRLSLSTDTA